MNINKIFYLGTCSTCKEILKSIKNPDTFELIDIKKRAITEGELENLYHQTKSYEALFSKKSRNYGAVKESIKSDEDYKKLILSDYTFLKRPVIQYNEKLFIGNEKKTKAEIAEQLG